MKVHYRPPLYPTLSHINPVHSLKPYITQAVLSHLSLVASIT